MKGYIYHLYDTTTLEVLYVGSSTSPADRIKAHKTASKRGETPFYRFIQESGIGFDIVILEETEFHTKRDLLKREAYWIDKYLNMGIELKNSVIYKKISNIPGNPNDNPIPVRLGELKPILQQEAFELGISLHRHILNIISVAVGA